jgi:phosphatidylglycerophosphate synthase
MFDARIRPYIDPTLNYIGQSIAKLGIGADFVTLSGMVVGILAGVSIGFGHYGLGLGLIALSRILDGLDGAVARATQKTDFGGYLDIVCGFVFYVAVPVGFGFSNPQFAYAAMLLIASFTLTGISFLAFATLAAKRGLETTAHGEKSFFYNTGLAEGTETIVVFCLMCLWPAWFVYLAGLYMVLCLLTVIQRTIAAKIYFR